MGFSSPAVQQPTVPVLPPIPPAANPPILSSSSAILASSQSAAARVRAAAGMGFEGTIDTSEQGLLTTPNTAKATLLGT